MATAKLTKRNIDATRPQERDVFVWDENMPGFGLKVTPAGTKIFVYQYRVRGGGTGTQRWRIGRYGAPWTPEQALRESKRIAVLVAQGGNPAKEKREQARAARTKAFAAYVEIFSAGYLETDWGKSWKQAKRQLELHAIPVLKDRPLPQIEPSHIHEVLDALRGRSGIQRSVWAVLSSLFRWAEKREDIDKNPMANVDPPAGSKARKRILTPDELIAAWRASFALEAPRGALVRLLMITLQRRSEVAALPWKELHKNTAAWHLDGSRAKNGVDHLVPLSALAMAELEEISWKTRGLVLPCSTGKTPVSNFSDMKSIFDESMKPILQELADARADESGEDRQEIEWTPWRLHDLRRTGSTNLQALGFPIEVTERVLNHHEGGTTAGVRGVYNLHDYAEEKRRALDAWAAHLQSLISGASKASNVVPLAPKQAEQGRG